MLVWGLQTSHSFLPAIHPIPSPRPHPAKKVQSLYDSLEAKDSEIYCQRAREMNSTLEPENTGLFVYSMQQLHLHAMFDPSLLEEERLVQHLKDVDSIR